ARERGRGARRSDPARRHRADPDHARGDTKEDLRVEDRLLGPTGLRLALRPDARGYEPGHRGDRRRQARPALAPSSARGARVPVTVKQRSSSLLRASQLLPTSSPDSGTNGAGREAPSVAAAACRGRPSDDQIAIPETITLATITGSAWISAPYATHIRAATPCTRRRIAASLQKYELTNT